MAKRKPQPKPKKSRIDYDLAAECIVFAVMNGDEAASEEYDRTVRTIQRYRRRMYSDPELSQVVAYKLDQVKIDLWPHKMGEALEAALDAVTAACKKIQERPDPNSLLALSGALGVLLDYQLAFKMLNERIKENSEYPANDRSVGTFAGVQAKA